MRPTEAVQAAFANYSDYCGRASRAAFWWFALFLLVAYVAVVAVAYAFGWAIETVLGGDERRSTLISLSVVGFWVLMFLPSISAVARRLHDTGRSGWWILAVPVSALIGLVVVRAADGPDVATQIALAGNLLVAAFLVVLLARDTKRERNRWGPPARGSRYEAEADDDERSVVERMEAAARCRKRGFRVTFAYTWAVLIGGLVAILALGGAIQLSFLTEGPPWWRFILGEVEITTDGIAGIAIGPVQFVITGAFATILISVIAISLATVFALLGSIGRLSKSAPIQSVATLYVSLVRGTPLLVQILFIWLALPQIWSGFGTVDALVMGTFAVAFNYGAYMTEIFRAGIQAVPAGQREAAAALGMSDRRIFFRIVMPQAFRIVIPAIGNEFIAMIKDTSLLAVIGVQELLWKARTVGSQNFKMLETLLLAALVYWVLTIIFSAFQERLEKRMARGDR